MKITLNNRSIDVAEHATLHSLVVAHVGGVLTGVAVAVNHAVIARAQHEHYVLKPNDSVLIIQATQGG